VAANTALLTPPAAAGHHHGTAGPVAHHFNNMRQQQATVRFGMWIFLVTEVLFFGGAFCAYTCYRIWFPREFEAGSAALNVGIALANTLLLLTSSMTCTLAIRAAYMANRGLLSFWLLVTITLAVLFLGLKSREYYLDYEEGLIPTTRIVTVQEQMPDGSFVPVQTTAFEVSLKKVLAEEKYKHPEIGIEIEKVNTRRVQLFFMFYYVITGLHVLHMVIGVGLLTWQLILSRMGFFDQSARYVYIEVMSLYWHFVDMVWMLAVPLLYLAGPHTLAQAVRQFEMAVGLATGDHH
jgi:cytochrome c oxidase subunit 3